MKLVFISGPSGSGKTTLSNQILLKIKNGIVLRTDNYYKTGIQSKIFAKFLEGYFDRNISFNYKLFKKDFNYIFNNGTSINERYYDFDKKTTTNFFNQKNNIDTLIIEGIFAKEFSRKLYNQKYYFLELKINKNECLNRVVQRDIKERGKAIKQAEKDFLKSWDIYYHKYKNKKINNNANQFTITKDTNIDQIIENLCK